MHETKYAWDVHLNNGLRERPGIGEGRKGRERARDSDRPRSAVDWRMPQPPDDSPDDGRFRRNLLRVMSVQVVALVLLWLLQLRYSR